MTDYEKLEELYNDINVLIAEDATDKSTAFEVWYENVKDFLQGYYGEGCIERMIFEQTWVEFRELEIADMVKRVAVCREIFIATKMLFRDFLAEMGD